MLQQHLALSSLGEVSGWLDLRVLASLDAMLMFITVLACFPAVQDISK